MNYLTVWNVKQKTVDFSIPNVYRKFCWNISNQINVFFNLFFLTLANFFSESDWLSNIVQMLLILLIFCREFRRQSCDWLYSHVQKRFHNFGSAKVIKSVGFNRKFYILWKVISRIYYTISYLKYYIYNICTT